MACVILTCSELFVLDGKRSNEAIKNIRNGRVGIESLAYNHNSGIYSKKRGNPMKEDSNSNRLSSERKLILISNIYHCTSVSCQHLEVSDFSTYSVDLAGKVQVMTLQRCSQCGKYLTLNGTEVPNESILGREAAVKPKLRTITLQLNSDVYDSLKTVIARDTRGDPTTIANDIVAMGLRDYKHLKHN